MKQCILTVGISASGKTTWAEAFVAEKAAVGEVWRNINRDDIRKEVFEIKTGNSFCWNEWKRPWEKDVFTLWERRIKEVLADPSKVDGVIVSDTNLNPSIRNMLFRKFEAVGCDITLKFFPIEFEEAVKRDLARPNPVGSHVIAEQIEKYWDQFGDKYVADTTLPKAVIVDIDGTVAHITTRKIFDWMEVNTDRPDTMVCDVVRGLKAQGYKIVVTSGRDAVSRDLTWEWLKTHFGFKPDELLMRAHKDMRKDTVVKRELFDAHIRNKYNVVLAIDDRPVVVRLWRKLGIQTLACGFQNKEF